MTDKDTVPSPTTSELPAEVRAFFSQIGAAGGAARTEAKRLASRQNLARGRKLRLVRIQADKRRAAAELARGHRSL